LYSGIGDRLYFVLLIGRAGERDVFKTKGLQDEDKGDEKCDNEKKTVGNGLRIITMD
jgi:hypothetical protein